MHEIFWSFCGFWFKGLFEKLSNKEKNTYFSFPLPISFTMRKKKRKRKKPTCFWCLKFVGSFVWSVAVTWDIKNPECCSLWSGVSFLFHSMILVFMIFVFFKKNWICHACELGNKLFMCFDISLLFLFTTWAATRAWDVKFKWVTRTCVCVSEHVYSFILFQLNKRGGFFTWMQSFFLRVSHV